jgi:hypothetical protein
MVDVGRGAVGGGGLRSIVGGGACVGGGGLAGS